MSPSSPAGGGGAAGACAVTGVGMVSSVGWTAASSCAAARAGLARTTELEDTGVLDLDTGELTPVVGHAVAAADGFSGLGRLVLLGQLALRDLLRGEGGDTGGTAAGATPGETSFAGVPFLVALPGGYYLGQKLARDLAEAGDSLPTPADTILATERKSWRERLERAYLERLWASAGVGGSGDLGRVHCGEQAAFFAVLSRAVGLVEGGSYPRVVVGAVDSLVDPGAVPALGELGVLKSAVQPKGFLPGETAVFLQLEAPGATAGRRNGALGLLGRPSVARAATHRFGEEPPLGRALASVVDEAAGTGDGQPPGLLVGNLNGDDWRALDWGYALPRLPAGIREAPLELPVASFGETGAASGAAAIALGLAAFARGWAGTERILAWATGDDGEKGAVLLTRAANGGA